MRSQRSWRTTELQVLRERYPHEFTADLAADMGRSVASLTKAAWREGIKKSPQLLSMIPIVAGDPLGVCQAKECPSAARTA